MRPTTNNPAIGTILFASMLLAFASGPLLAADWYVDAANPNCPGSGTSADPFCTITGAVAAAASNDTVYVAAGSYSPGVVNLTKNLSFVGSPGAAVNGLFQVFKPISGPGPQVSFESLEINGEVYNNGSTVTLSNSTVTSSGGIAVRNLASACCDLLGFSAAHTTITDCVISATGAGTAVRNDSLDEASSTGTTASATVTISNSTLSGTNGIVNSSYVDIGSSFFAQSGTSFAHVTIANSTVVGSVAGVSNAAETCLYGWPGAYQSTANVTVTNSTVTGAAVGISNPIPSTPFTTTSTKISNTIVAGNGQDLSGTVTSLGHNCVGSTAGGTLAGSAAGDLLNVDPMFVDAAGGDYRFLPASPCIDAGDNAAAAGLASDLDGHARFFDDPATPDTGSGPAPLVDIGAYEYCGLSYGAGCPGAGGVVPELTQEDCAVAGQPIALTISNGVGGSTAFLFLGMSQAALPIGPTGCTLYAAPLFPQALPVPLDGAGSATIAAVIPASAAGMTITLQAFIVDGSQPHGFSNSNGLLMPIS